MGELNGWVLWELHVGCGPIVRHQQRSLGLRHAVGRPTCVPARHLQHPRPPRSARSVADERGLRNRGYHTRAMTASAAADAPRRLIGCMVRGAITGLAVYATLYVAFEYAQHDIGTHLDRHPETDGLLALGATVVTALKIGIPLSFISGLLVAWAVGLRRPWAVSLLGLLASGFILCALGVLTQEPVPGWLLMAMIIGAFTGVAVIPPDRLALP